MSPTAFWEPNDFAELAEEALVMDVIPEEPQQDITLPNVVAAIVQKVLDPISQWDPPPPDSAGDALLLLGLAVVSPVAWDFRSDMLAAAVLGLLSQKDLRAHSSGIHMYGHVAWQKSQELPSGKVLRIDKAIQRCSHYLVDIAVGNDAQEWNVVFERARLMDTQVLEAPAQRANFDRSKHWTADIDRHMLDLASRFAKQSNCKVILDGYGEWCQEEMPPPTRYVDFLDATMELCIGGGATQVAKSPTRNCYVHIPVSLAFRPSDDSVAKMRRFFATTFAGNPETRRADMALEVLALHGKSVPPVILVYRGPRGDGKSTRTLLRDSFYGDAHCHLSPSCFTVPEEFRKQGGQVAFARFVTMQECQGGMELIEDIFKKFISGEKLGCRPNYGASTTYYSWEFTAKFWEMNLLTPSIKGDPAEIGDLESWVRRIFVGRMMGSYITNTDDVNVEDKVFLSDPELRAFLTSEEAKAVYARHFLMPFIRRYSEQDKMANGGLRPWTPAPSTPVQEEAPRSIEAPWSVEQEQTCVRVHTWLRHHNTRRVAGPSAVNRCVILPGARTMDGRRGATTRADRLEAIVKDFPCLMKKDSETFKVLNVDLEKMEALVALHGGQDVFGSYLEWGDPWAVKDDRNNDISAWEEVEQDWSEVAQADCRTEADSLVEVVNLAALQEHAIKHIDRGQDILEAYINRCEHEGADYDHPTFGRGFVTLMVQYYRKGEMPGRRYPHGVAAQLLTRQARRVAFTPHCCDVDIVNCHPSLLCRFLTSVGKSQQFPLLTKYVEHPDAWRRLVHEYADIDLSEAKLQLIKVMYFAKPFTDLPMLLGLAREVQLAV